MSAEKQSRLDSVVASVSQTLVALMVAWFGVQVIESRDRLVAIETTQASIMASINKVEHKVSRVEAEVSRQENRLRAIE